MSSSARYAARFTPQSAPSREMSVWITHETPRAASDAQNGPASTALVSRQPETATRPPRASTPTAMRAP